MADQVSTATTTLPDWISGPWKDLIDRAVTASNKPYTPYPGQRLAPLTSDQVWAQNLARTSVGRTQPLVTAATDLATNAAAANTEAMAGRGPSQVDPNRILGVNPQRFTDLPLDQYMSPYTDLVVQDVLREANKQAQIQQNKAKQAATAGRAFGGSRGALLETETAANSERSIQDLVNRLKSQAFESARQSGEADLSRQYNADAAYAGRVNDTLSRNADAVLRSILGAGSNVNALTSAARTGQQINAADIATLMGIGEQNQKMDQAALDLAVKDYLTQQGYEQSQIDRVLSVLRGVPSEGTRTTTSPGPDLLGEILGVGAAGVGLLGPTGLGLIGKGGSANEWINSLFNGTPSGVESILSSIDNGSLFSGAASGLDQWLMGF